jgi:sarcosine oxidase subunit beta
MNRYSFWSPANARYRGHRRWPKASPAEPRIIRRRHRRRRRPRVATAYYLARKHGIRNVAVLEKAWLGGGNSGRNTQVVRSNYFWPESAAFYAHSLRLYESLSAELNFNVMLSQRGILTLAHSEHELESLRRWANAILVSRIDSELMTPPRSRSSSR